MLRDTITSLKAKRGICEQEFLRLFSEVRNIPLELGKELKVQRIVKKQVHRLWSAKWDRKSNEEDSNQKTVIEFLSECDRDVFPVINILLQVLATLPVSVTTAERTFSNLKRIKTWLRTTMNEVRLVGLALLATHRDIRINPDKVIDRFCHERKS
ncbi:hypothetical protein PR048_005824 [Dryococelus australis]|uniref:HAT C-terminal dimerisation domain-containing protein n=1 Tax=Dryococelus australis TaxID=614101 RepID=A0ABQ9I9D6_9NEOP|nr:hypothetical protein PR048_005824 [Dryococelus australis]